METISCSRQPRILVVDDHEASSQHMMASLSRLRVSVRRAKTGSGALQIATSWLPDLLLMDFYLPDCDGLHLTRQIRAQWPESHPQPGVVMVSAEGCGERQAELEKLDIEHTVTKPVAGQTLRKLVMDRLGQPQIPAVSAPLETGLTALFTEELEHRLPKLEQHLLHDETEQAANLVHQLIASSALTGERELETQFRLLNRLLRCSAGAAELAHAYYGIFEAARGYLQRSAQSGSDG